MENKYNKWVFTWNSSADESLVPARSLEDYLRQHYEYYVFQRESGEETGRLHYQGCFKTKIRKRQGTLLNEFSDIFGEDPVQYLTLNRMCGTWEENRAYCTKEETRIGEPHMSSTLKVYEGEDIHFFQRSEDWYSWQIEVCQNVFELGTLNPKVAHDRQIIWITDQKGNCGKSIFTKFLCFNNSDIIKLPFGSAAQLRSAAINAGPRKLYIIDIPRTLGADDSLASIISSIEDIKNGFVVSAFYGKYQFIQMPPPHVLIFSNDKCPWHLMSTDRWAAFNIDQETKRLSEQLRMPKSELVDPHNYYGGEEDYDIN